MTDPRWWLKGEATPVTTSEGLSGYEDDPDAAYEESIATALDLLFERYRNETYEERLQRYMDFLSTPQAATQPRVYERYRYDPLYRRARRVVNLQLPEYEGPSVEAPSRATAARPELTAPGPESATPVHGPTPDDLSEGPAPPC